MNNPLTKSLTWTEERILNELKKWIEDGKWEGQKHLQKNNNKLFNAIYKYMGFSKAFRKIGLNYEEYKKSNRKWTDEKILSELKKWLDKNGWKGSGHLHQNYRKLYDAIYNNMGFENAFEKLGLDYKEYAIIDKNLSEEETIEELSSWILKDKWEGLQHLRNHHTYLYKGLKEMGVEKAFKKIGLDYTYHDKSIKWTNKKIATDLKKYIKENGWRGTAKFREEEPLLYAVLYKKMSLEKAFEMIGLDYEEYRVNEQWNEEKMLSELKEWLDSGKWNGTGHFMKNNRKLYGSIYKSIGMEEAFAKIGLKYTDFIIQEGYPRDRIERETLSELKKIIENQKWKGINNLKEKNYFLYISLNRIGIEEAFHKIGLNYNDYKIVKDKKNVDFLAKEPSEIKWTEDEIISELKKWIEEGNWNGQSHLSKNNSALCNAIRRNMGMVETFKRLGLNYYDYKKKKRPNWTEEKMLSELKKWIDEGNWNGTGHFQKNNSALYNAINRYIGMEEAFKKIELHYEDYKK